MYDNEKSRYCYPNSEVLISIPGFDSLFAPSKPSAAQVILEQRAARRRNSQFIKECLEEAFKRPAQHTASMQIKASPSVRSLCYVYIKLLEKRINRLQNDITEQVDKGDDE